MQVHLPVHQAAGDEELLDGVDAFRVHGQLPFVQVEHLDDARRADGALHHARVEAVAAQVVDAVHVELAGHQLVQETLGMAVAEHVHGQVEPPAGLLVHPPHHEQRQFLVADAVHQAVLQAVREGAVPDVVQQDGGAGGLGLVGRDVVPLLPQLRDGLAHEVHRPERMLEAGVLRPGIHHGRQPQLLDAPQPLHVGMLDEVVKELRGDVDEPEHGVVDDFALVLVHSCLGHRVHIVFTMSLVEVPIT